MATIFKLISNSIQADRKELGLSKTLYSLSLKAVNRLVLLKILNCVTIDSVDPKCLRGNEKYRYTFLDRDRLSEFSANKEYELSPTFLDGAFERGDECYAILDGNVLASYGWYSSRPTGVSFDSSEDGNEGLLLHFSSEYIYMFKGYTHPDYRGQRLHAIGMTRALESYLDRGHKGLVSFVESDNYASLKSCYRMGYKDFGKIYFVKLFGKYLIYCSGGCDEYRFRLEGR